MSSSKKSKKASKRNDKVEERFAGSGIKEPSDEQEKKRQKQRKTRRRKRMARIDQRNVCQQLGSPREMPREA
ncbi:hypothetical protein PV326_008749 [Microctonus aethiopoides]|nr:hypothetical protein PV326_008749 [Microctonus aethiopoides]